MPDTYTFGWLLFWSALAGLAVILCTRFTTRLGIPAPALMLAGSAIAVAVLPALHAPPERTVNRLVTVALVLVLFDGGMTIGWQRFRAVAGPVVVLGVLGTVLTVAGAALLLRYAVDLPWYSAVLVATAVAPTDPAVVFSVLGDREIAGNSGPILQGESGANDPVGIALMAGLLSARGLSGHAFGHVAGEFALQMTVGVGFGAIGGFALVTFIRVSKLPDRTVYSLATLGFSFALYGITIVAHGSGFLAVFVAGILLGDVSGHGKQPVERFHSALAGLGEIVAFLCLGLTIDLGEIEKFRVWGPGLLLGAALTVFIRPVLVFGCLAGAGLARNEKGFVLFAGLKGAVPILLGSYLLSAAVPNTARLYGMVVVVVMFSILVQGGLLPVVAKLLGIEMGSQPSQPSPDGRS